MFALSAAAQPRPAPPKKWVNQRTADGQSDLQGIWSNATITPLERPPELAGKEYFTAQEAAEYEKKVLREGNRDRRSSDPTADLKGAYNEIWFDHWTQVVLTTRTSIVMDTSNGLSSPLTPACQTATS